MGRLFSWQNLCKCISTFPTRQQDSIEIRLRTRGSQRVRHDWAADLIWSDLMVQWIRIRPPSQGHGFDLWSWEDSTCPRATKSVCHNYWSPCAQSLCSATREATTVRCLYTTVKRSPRSLQPEKAHMQQQRSSATKNKINFFFFSLRVTSQNHCELKKKKESRLRRSWSRSTEVTAKIIHKKEVERK